MIFSDFSHVAYLVAAAVIKTGSSRPTDVSPRTIATAIRVGWHRRDVSCATGPPPTARTSADGTTMRRGRRLCRRARSTVVGGLPPASVCRVVAHYFFHEILLFQASAAPDRRRTEHQQLPDLALSRYYCRRQYRAVSCCVRSVSSSFDRHPLLSLRARACSSFYAADSNARLPRLG